MNEFDNTLKLVKAGHFLRSADASPKKPSKVMIDVIEMRNIANDEVMKLRNALTDIINHMESTASVVEIAKTALKTEG